MGNRFDCFFFWLYLNKFNFHEQAIRVYENLERRFTLTPEEYNNISDVNLKLNRLDLAEDYIKKPISIKNLILRINNLFKRLPIKSNSNFIISKNQILIENRKIKLTKIEFELLEIFTKNLDRIFKRQEILDKLAHGGIYQQPDNQKFTPFGATFKIFANSPQERDAIVGYSQRFGQRGNYHQVSYGGIEPRGGMQKYVVVIMVNNDAHFQEFNQYLETLKNLSF